MLYDVCGLATIYIYTNYLPYSYVHIFRYVNFEDVTNPAFLRFCFQGSSAHEFLQILWAFFIKLVVHMTWLARISHTTSSNTQLRSLCLMHQNFLQDISCTIHYFGNTEWDRLTSYRMNWEVLLASMRWWPLLRLCLSGCSR